MEGFLTEYWINWIWAVLIVVGVWLAIKSYINGKDDGKGGGCGGCGGCGD